MSKRKTIPGLWKLLEITFDTPYYKFMKFLLMLACNICSLNTLRYISRVNHTSDALKLYDIILK